MEIIVSETYEELSQRAANDLLVHLKQKKAPLWCPTSGSTPAGLYKALVQQIKEQGIDYSSWNFVGLDEWAGMNGTDEGSCRDFVNQHLFYPLGIAEERISFFDGRAQNKEAECDRVEAFIQQNGGIDVAIVGLGLNGHVGMNEPGTPVSQRSHVAHIHPHTQQVGQKYFTAAKDLSQGLTLGLATLLDAQHIFLMANGPAKAAIVKKMVEDEPNEQLPATLLRQHRGFRVYLDKEAAQLLS